MVISLFLLFFFLSSTVKFCGHAGDILNGHFVYTGVKFGDTATAICDEGWAKWNVSSFFTLLNSVSLRIKTWICPSSGMYSLERPPDTAWVTTGMDASPFVKVQSHTHARRTCLVAYCFSWMSSVILNLLYFSQLWIARSQKSQLHKGKTAQSRHTSTEMWFAMGVMWEPLMGQMRFGVQRMGHGTNPLQSAEVLARMTTSPSNFFLHI